MRNWTVIYLVDCDKNVSQLNAAQHMFDKILALKIPPGVAMVFCIKMPVSGIQQLDPSFRPNPALPPGQLTTVFYRVEALEAPAGGRESQLVKLADEEQSFDLTNKEHVKRYFKEIVLQADNGAYRAKKYLLFTWGHGAAAGIFFNGAFERLSILTMEDLKYAIDGAFEEYPAEKIDTMIMMNCYMQYFDAMYSLRAARVDFLMTSQFGLDFVGYNYTAIFTAIYSPQGISPKDLAICAVESLTGPAQQLNLQGGSFFASDLSVCDQLGAAICKLGARLSAALPDIKDVITSIFAVDDDYTHPASELLDLFLFADRMGRQAGAPWRQETDAILALKDRLLIKQYIGPRLEVVHPGMISRGCAICVPQVGDGVFFENFVQPGPRSSLFSKLAACQWGGFINSYTQLLPTGPIQS
jgi:hypothetical protein